LAIFHRYFVHTVVLIMAVALTGYASINKGLPAAANLRLGVVNAEGQAFGQGGATGQVELGRAGTIIKPIGIPNAAQVQHTPTQYTTARTSTPSPRSSTCRPTSSAGRTPTS